MTKIPDDIKKLSFEKAMEELSEIVENLERGNIDLEKSIEINKNLDSQIQTYIEQERLNQKLIDDYKKQLEMSEEMIKLVKPKWHENKYLWFFGGIIITSGSVYLAGQIK